MSTTIVHERRNGGQLAAEALQREGVTHVFALAGGHIDPTWFAAPEAGIKRIDVRHEAAAAYCAEGWALATGEPGVCMVTAGPGLTNALTGLATAFTNGSPVVCIAGSATVRGNDTGEVESLDQFELARSVTKWARRVFHIERIPEYIAAAFKEATTGRPGPVYLEIPIDVIHAEVDIAAVHTPPPMWREQRALAAPATLVEDAARLLMTAKRPAIVAGSGVWWSQAHKELRGLVEQIGIPVVTRQGGRGVIPDDHPLCFGRDWQNVVHQADVVLIVGTQLNYFFGYGQFSHLDHLLQIDINPSEIGRTRVPVSVGIVGDAGTVLAQLTEAMTPLDTTAWVAQLRQQADEIAARKAELARSEQSPIHPYRVCAEIASMLDRDATVITDGSNCLIWANVAFHAYQGGCVPSMAPLGTIGHGIGYAIAGALARPGTQVVWVVGDGSFGFHCMELDTAARFGLPIVTVVMNNGGWSATWSPLGQRHYESLAPGFGGDGELVEHPDQLRPALERAFASERPSILNVLIEPAPEYFSGRYLGSVQ